LLLTDGMETEPPYVSEVVEAVKASGITIHAISLGIEAIAGVEMISQETGKIKSFQKSDHK
jgi:hypothetical protein